MAKNKLIIHIGGSKCASSSIQTFLSHNPILEKNQDRKILRYKYFCVYPDRYLQGEKIKTNSEKNMFNYLSSATFTALKDQLYVRLIEILEKLNENEIPILSCESRSNEILDNHEEFIKIFQKLNVDLEIFMVIRDPISWINSAWWQWGVWTGHDLNFWLSQMLGFNTFNWFLQIKKWKKINQVTRFELVDLNSNILENFKQFLKISNSWQEKTNSGSSAAFLDFMIKYKNYYNRSVHDPQIEFWINKLLSPFLNYQTPFVISKENQKLILDKTYKSSQNLINEFENQMYKNLFLKNSKYFSLDEFEKINIRNMQSLVTKEETYELIRGLVDLILKQNPRVRT